MTDRRVTQYMVAGRRRVGQKQVKVRRYGYRHNVGPEDTQRLCPHKPSRSLCMHVSYFMQKEGKSGKRRSLAGTGSQRSTHGLGEGMGFFCWEAVGVFLLPLPATYIHKMVYKGKMLCVNSTAGWGRVAIQRQGRQAGANRVRHKGQQVS